ncbi:cytochrome P450 [Vreelandella populi]|uniref:Cytochrome P450 n=1 Tax=Vreelandella populi TaxID=2498858 RepID=A0A433LH39_9GAMM|nr:cytochrome P450 [Halomonas populi]RUR40810.1 cytochrome P450 [Halomonas populi]RUR49317.1 cytochrome P450 [Halomonas populi]
MVKETVTDSLPTASFSETLSFLLKVMAPNIAKGVIIRRPGVMHMAEHWALDKRSVKQVQAFNNKYGKGPLLFKTPFKPMALVLDPEDANRVMEETPEPFATAESAKKSALSHFEPDMALISHGKAREERRRLNEEVLQSGCPMHSFSAHFSQVAEQEVQALLETVHQHNNKLDWSLFINAWNRIVRRVVLGDAARDDDPLTQELVQLRKAANWGFMRPKRKRLRRKFHDRLAHYVDQAEPNSLAAKLSDYATQSQAKPLDQMPQWLFAFEPAGMATFRALALLCAHPKQAELAQAEADQKPHPQSDNPFLKACVLEALRLWPTTPLILRETTERTCWSQGEMPTNTTLLIHAPYFHRDDRQLDMANRFAPEIWLDPEQLKHWPLLPFSGGPGICPGRHIVLLVTSAVLAAMMRNHQFRLDPSDRLTADEPMPALLSNFHLCFRVKQADSSSNQESAAL